MRACLECTLDQVHACLERAQNTRQNRMRIQFKKAKILVPKPP